MDGEIAAALNPRANAVKRCLEKSSSPPSKLRVRLSIEGSEAPALVSTEGACAAYHRFRRLRATVGGK